MILLVEAKISVVELIEMFRFGFEVLQQLMIMSIDLVEAFELLPGSEIA